MNGEVGLTDVGDQQPGVRGGACGKEGVRGKDGSQRVRGRVGSVGGVKGGGGACRQGGVWVGSVPHGGVKSHGGS